MQEFTLKVEVPFVVQFCRLKEKQQSEFNLLNTLFHFRKSKTFNLEMEQNDEDQTLTIKCEDKANEMDIEGNSSA